MNSISLVQLLWVGAGGFVGSILRFTLTIAVQRSVPFSGFPYGTLSVNLLGCLAIGLLGGLVESRQLLNPELRLFLFIGVLGGFTTYSTFAFEGFEMLREGVLLSALASIALHVLVGFSAVWLGYHLTSSS